MNSIINRALSGEFPYDPDKEWMLRHPSQKVEEIGYTTEIADATPISQEAMVALLAVHARHELEGRKVYHLEVVFDPVMLLIGYRAIVGRR